MVQKIQRKTHLTFGLKKQKTFLKMRLLVLVEKSLVELQIIFYGPFQKSKYLVEKKMTATTIQLIHTITKKVSTKLIYFIPNKIALLKSMAFYEIYSFINGIILIGIFLRFSFYYPQIFAIVISIFFFCRLAYNYDSYILLEDNVFSSFSKIEYLKCSLFNKTLFWIYITNALAYKLFFSDKYFYVLRIVFRINITINFVKWLFLGASLNTDFFFSLLFYFIYLINLVVLNLFRINLYMDFWHHLLDGIFSFQSVVDLTGLNLDDVFYQLKNEDLTVVSIIVILLIAIFRICILIPFIRQNLP